MTDLGKEEAYGDLSDVGDMQLDLSKDEKLRAAALIMAIRYHTETIIKDAAMYRELVHNQQHLSPSTVTSVIRIAVEFENFLLGKTSIIESIEVRENEKAQSKQP